MNYVNEQGEIIAYEWKTPFNHNTNEESNRVSLVCPEPTRTQQHQEQEANINTIVRNFGLTGQLPQIPLPPPLEEFADIFDFQSAMNTMAAAKHSFQQLPADVRDAFKNDPHNFVGTVDSMLAEQDPARRENNLGILRAMGLMVPEGPKVDRTTLGDVLAAIKENGGRNPPPDQGPPKTP